MGERMTQKNMAKEPFKMKFDIGTIKHLGLQMYSTLPPVIGELVSNAWDANATKVEITIPEGPIDIRTSEIIVQDTGIGMSDDKDGEISHLKLNYRHLEENSSHREVLLPSLEPSGTVEKGTKITLRQISKFQNRSIPIQVIRRGLARRFSIIGASNNFEVAVNGIPITPEERDLKRLLQKDAQGKPYLWEYKDVKIKEGADWTVSGWIGAYDRTRTLDEGIGYGITIMARGKLAQEPFVFDTTVGQQYALSYLVGELHAEFVDAKEDTIGTTRNSLVWETEANKALLEWGQKEVNRIARQWAEKRGADNEAELEKNTLYQKFKEEAALIDNKRAAKIADKLIRETIRRNVLASEEQVKAAVQLCLDFLEFDSFVDMARDLTETDLYDIPKLIDLFREWEIVEAKEMMKVTQGRIDTIEKLQNLINTNALEVPTLHNFLKTFPWVLDPRWMLIADEKRYSDLLRNKYPDTDRPEEERRIDFMCVCEGTTLVVVEIKRPKVKASRKELEQIEEYVIFMRDYVLKTSDPDMRFNDVVGYLLCGDLVDTPQIRGRRENLANSRIYVRLYKDLLRMVEGSHREFMTRYERLRSKRLGLTKTSGVTDGKTRVKQVIKRAAKRVGKRTANPAAIKSSRTGKKKRGKKS